MPKRGVDALLTSKGKTLQTGQSVSFQLIKGPAMTVTADPVDPKAPPESFPLVAKFPESVVKPEFAKEPWKDGRLYQQDVPKPVADSDEDEEEKQQPKKRWKYKKRQDAPSRQWILQEQVDFLETMVARREKRPIDHKKLSSRYEGMPEHNSSNYILLMPSDTNSDTIQVRTLPTPNATIAFAQPAARKTYSLSEAEQAIQDQRNNVRTMHHHNEPAAALQHHGPTSVNNSKSRLLNKLKAKTNGDGDIDEADDVMGDVAFRNRKGGGGAARKELLSTLGDGLAVSDDGVLGGTNDQAFGGRQRFGQFQAQRQQQQKTEASAAGGQQGEKEERGADGAAMEEDFYQRDVQAEYEELDYDANEQFDDDDVDLGEGEVAVERGGFGDEDFDDELEELELEEDAVSGAAGLATVAGFKAMLAKARGEVPAVPAESAEVAAAEKKEVAAKRPASPKEEKDKDEGDHMAKIMAAADKAAQVAKGKATTKAGAKKAVVVDSAKQVDENGLRLIDLESVRREIWLNHGSIAMKRLMKFFEVKKKSSPERQNKFREVVKELCTMTSDPVGGRMLVLKQHYSNMG